MMIYQFYYYQFNLLSTIFLLLNNMKGTHAHAFVSAFNDLNDVKFGTLMKNTTSNNSDTDSKNYNETESVDFVEEVLSIRKELGFLATHEGELAAFISYACCYPTNALLLVDTYDTLSSGVLNFLCVAIGLLRCGYKPVGIR